MKRDEEGGSRNERNRMWEVGGGVEGGVGELGWRKGSWEDANVRAKLRGLPSWIHGYTT